MVDVGFVQRASTVASVGSQGSGAVQANNQLRMAIGHEAIQRAGEAKGLPQAEIEQSQARFSRLNDEPSGGPRTISEAMDRVSREYNLTPAQRGEAERDLQRSLDKMVAQMAEGDDVRAARSGAKGGSGGGSWLMRLAEKLGEKLDVMARDMDDMASRITDDTPSLTAKFGAKSQEFGIMMNAATNAIKTIGEAQANSARKG